MRATRDAEFLTPNGFNNDNDFLHEKDAWAGNG
jgi:hypothetical protein